MNPMITLHRQFNRSDKGLITFPLISSKFPLGKGVELRSAHLNRPENFFYNQVFALNDVMEHEEKR